MKRLWIICIGMYAATLNISINAAARSEPSSYLHDTLDYSGVAQSSSSVAQSSSSMESFSLGEPGRPLTPAEYERLTGAITELRKTGITSINVETLINWITDGYLQDPIAGDLLAFVDTTLLDELRLQRMRDVLNKESVIDPDIEGLAAIIKSDYELATISPNVISKILGTLEKHFDLAPMQEAAHLITLLPEQKLEELIDAAVEGRLADMVTPLQFLELVSASQGRLQNISKERRQLAHLIVIAAMNNNIKQNPAYNLFTNDLRQNEVLQTSETALNEYYAQTGRQRPRGTIAKPAKKSFAQRWFARRK